MGVLEAGLASDAKALADARLDDQGPYWVPSHFDTAPPDRPRTSRPLRVAQDPVGPGFGAHLGAHSSFGGKSR